MHALSNSASYNAANEDHFSAAVGMFQDILEGILEAISLYDAVNRPHQALLDQKALSDAAC